MKSPRLYLSLIILIGCSLVFYGLVIVPLSPSLQLDQIVTEVPSIDRTQLPSIEAALKNGQGTRQAFTIVAGLALVILSMLAQRAVKMAASKG